MMRRSFTMRTIRIGTKISLIVIGMFLVFSMMIAFDVIGEMEKGIKTFATEKAKRDLQMTDKLIGYKHPGDWQIRDGQLYKGDTVMNGNFELVDEIGEASGDTVTIFQADERVATNVMIDGERAVGTKVSDTVADLVLHNGEQYYGEAVVVGKTYQAAYQPIKNTGGEVIGILYVGAEQSLIDVIVSSFLTRFFIVFLIAMGIAIAVILWYIRKFTRRIGRVSEAIRQAGTGDFTHTVTDTVQDEIGQLAGGYNEMKTNLQKIISNGMLASEQVGESTRFLLRIAEQTAQESEQIAASIAQVATGAESQTHSTQENLAAVEEFAIGIQRIAEKSTEVAEAAVSSKEQAETGGRSAHRTVEQMSSIHDSVRSTDAAIKSLEMKSQGIGEMVAVIQNISKQTNLLALNASIEAARAGEHGRGFTVVSTEVRKLAEESARSSERIGELVHAMEVEMRQSMEAMSWVMLEVQDGLRLTHETEQNFRHIVEMNGHIAGQIEEMAATTEQMSAGVQQVAASFNEIAQIAKVASHNSRQVAASAEGQQQSIKQVTSSSEALSVIATELQESMGQFKI
ncbi:methyl-accepting chemotaxis protein [Paenibacillus sp. P96]|uniref:Methyl-accepting chemotaxis protein n=1 Tax=Paenibacillus zeirhizosphaerae TaxID=2987519 RepID=A0ABT9FNG7_9BACL|nr:methyl-accepting chemotaxis protein [Paenibacillus sp. P96]MDP4096276.1 methyl-accepting chemotaxis protein [Paenibacillus sp. P96]